MFKDKYIKSLNHMSESIRSEFEIIGEPNLADELILIDNKTVSFIIHKDDLPYLILSEDKKNYKLKLHIPTLKSPENQITDITLRVLCAFCSYLTSKAEQLSIGIKDFFDYYIDNNVDILDEISMDDMRVTGHFKYRDYLTLKIQKIKL